VERVHPHDATTVPAWISALAGAYHDAPCVSDAHQRLTYRELENASGHLARGLLARGYGKGSRIGLLFGNGVDWVVWWAAISRIGALCVPISTFLQPAELARVARHADLALLVSVRHFLERDFEDVIARAFPTLPASILDDGLALPDVPFLRNVVLDDSQATWARGIEWIAEAGRHPAWGDILETAQAEVHEGDEALCIYTSGQSADPKGVVHSHGAVVLKAQYFREMFQFTADTTTNVTMPFFWVGGLVMDLFPTMDAGGSCACSERSTWGAGAVVGKSNSSTAVLDPFASFQKVPSLGMTETFGMYSWGNELPLPEYPIAAPIDVLQPGFELRCADEDGNEVPEGVPGEILVRGPTVALRLQKVPHADVFTPDGFLRTGDRAIRHGSRLHFLGRIGDMIKTSGANVSPPEVERELQSLDGVAVAHVVGLADSERGQVVAAAVVRAPGSTLTADDIRTQLRERLSVYKVPRAIVFFDSIDQIPMTPTMKVRKRELAELIAQELEERPTGEDGTGSAA
jgi:acyl-CoA synthetase (AMP-forming)/AMP-acid ligase II